VSATAPSAVADGMTAATVMVPSVRGGTRPAAYFPWDNQPSQPGAVPDRAGHSHRPDPRHPRRPPRVAIVAHVDHGKTLVDAMLRQTGAFRSNQAVVDRVMDSGDLEHEGIHILAKQTTIDHAGSPEYRRHARPRGFGGESAVAADGRFGAPPRRRRQSAAADYVLQKAMARRLPVIVAVDKMGRGDARRPRSSTTSTSCSWASAPTPIRSSSRSSTPTPSWAPRRATWTSPGPTSARCSTCSSR
jgi:hypothetical protein